MRRSKGGRGSTMLEFALVGTLFLMVWISTVQLAIGMWRYHTIQNAVKVAGTYTAVHGSDCSTGGNSCGIAIQDIANVLKTNMIGVDPAQVTVTFNAMSSDHTTVASSVTCQLYGGSTPCTSNTTSWPPSSYNTPGTDFEIKTEYQLHSTLATVWLPGFTHQAIMF
jgi:Flp pilus assembly protein TadG